LKHSDQSTDNGIDGDVKGTSIQAGSIGEVHLNTPRRFWWHRRYAHLGIAAAVVAAAV
jgi:hypothetical protein